MFSFIKRLFRQLAGSDAESNSVEPDNVFAQFAAMSDDCHRLDILSLLNDLRDTYENYRVVKSMLDITRRKRELDGVSEIYANCAHEMLLKTSSFVNAAASKGLDAKPAARNIIALIYEDLKARRFA